MSYLVPASCFQCETLVKKSRFIARVEPVEDRTAVNQALARIRGDYPDAGHHCWAYAIGRAGEAASAGSSDDGEPSGSAGKPILNVLQHSEFGDVLVVVVRYFGGIKLGVGGLVRAYGGAAQAALEGVATRRKQVLHQRLVTLDFSQEQALRHLASELDIEVLRVDYTEAVVMHLLVPESALGGLSRLCAARQWLLCDEGL